MREGWRQKELREKGWIANCEAGQKQRWKHDKLPLLSMNGTWYTTSDAIRLQRRWEKFAEDLFRKKSPE